MEAAEGISQSEEILWALIPIFGEMLKSGSVCPNMKLRSGKMREGVGIYCFLIQFLGANTTILV